LNDQIAILETMAPTDFIDFRGYLTTASGFQSLQFRLVENRLGLVESLRFKFNQQPYDYPFTDEESRTALKRSVDEPSMLRLIEAWLERTPGLVHYEHNEDTGTTVEYN
jgi:tryptophan 2,3-dioxygenase